MQHVRVELPGVPECLSVYVTQYLPQSDKKAGKGELKLQVKAFGGVTMGRPRYSWNIRRSFSCRAQARPPRSSWRRTLR